MAMMDKLKKLADQAKEKAGPLAEQAAQKANELADQAKEKAGPLADQAKERATDLAGKAAPAVSSSFDKAAGSIDKATGGRFTEHLDKAQGAVHDTANKVANGAAGGPKDSGAPSDLAEPDPAAAAPVTPTTTPGFADPVVPDPKHSAAADAGAADSAGLRVGEVADQVRDES